MEDFLLLDSVSVLSTLGVISAVFLLLALLYQKNRTERGKWILFLGISIPVLTGTLFLVLATVYEHTHSATRGPVHWHADLEIYRCGKRIDLKNPTGLSNRIGTPLLHEHNDGRIHVEGTVLQLSDVNLAEFFHAIGGEMNGEHLAVPTDEKILIIANGERCEDGSPGILQTFVYRTDEMGAITQEKLADSRDYIMSPETRVPPGDCIIIEFGPLKERTDHLCASYRLSDMNGRDDSYGN